MNTTVAVICGMVGATLAAPFAQSEIIYNSSVITLERTDYRVEEAYSYPNPAALNLDLNGDGTDDFSIFSHQPFPEIPFIVFFGARGLNGSYYEGQSSLVLESLPAGVALGSGPQWSADLDWPAWPLPAPAQNWWEGGHWYGEIGAASGTTSYIGFKLKVPDGPHFGWMEITLGSGGYAGALTINGWAYESTPNASIVTGDKGDPAPPASAVPEPSTYALFGMALLGALIASRKRVAK